MVDKTNRAGRAVFEGVFKNRKILLNNSEIFNYLADPVQCQAEFLDFPWRIPPVHSSVIQY